MKATCPKRGKLVLFVASFFGAMGVSRANTTQFISTVQFVVQEPSPELLQRSQRLVREQFVNSIEALPRLSDRPYNQHVMGNEMVFYLVTDQDNGGEMQEALMRSIQALNRRVKLRGLLSLYRTTLAQQPTGGYLETAVDSNHAGVVSIVAEAVPLRDVLKQLKSQLNELSYLIPGECGDRRVNWNFGKAQGAEPRNIDTVMTELAGLFNLKVEKQNDTHVFNGECGDAGAIPTTAPLIARSPFIPIQAALPSSAQQISFPLPQLGY